MTPENGPDEEESFLEEAIDGIGDTIEELTNKIASILGSDQDTLHDRDKGF